MIRAWRPAALPSRQALLTLALFAVLMATVLALGASAPAGRRYDLDSGGPEGLLGLRLWLEEMGYRVGTTDGERFRLPAADLLFVYPNQHHYTEEEAADLTRWVGQGRTLVVIGPAPGDTALSEALGVRPQGGLRFEQAAELWQQAPLLPEAPAQFGRLDLHRPLDLSGAATALPVVGTDDGQVTAAVRRLGGGTVWYLSTRHDLVNEALKDRGQAALVPALLRTVPDGGQVVFDTYHLVGPAPAQTQTPTLYDWLYGTPTGWATLFCLLVLLLYLLLQGVRLGRPLPVLAETRRREAAEYVTAMAGLQRRARLGRTVAAYHKRRLKVGLSRRYGLRADLPDADFVLALTAAGHVDDPTIERIHRLLTGLSGRPDEQTLVRQVAEVDEVLER